MDAFLTWISDPKTIRGIATTGALIFAAYLFVLMLWKLPNWLSKVVARPPMSWGTMLQTGKVGEIADWFIWRFTLFGSAAIVAIGAAAWIEHGLGFGIRIFGLSLLFGAACTCSGWLLGLLFGVPRTLARGQPAPAPPTAVPAAAPAGQPAATGQAAPQPTRADAARVASGVNTNLEDISDWLTKTIVGVGLTQLYSVPGFVWAKAGQLNKFGFGWDGHGQLLALGLFVYFATGGFWLGYVGTRTVLTALLNMIDSAPPAPKATGYSDDDNTTKLKDYVMSDDKSSFDPVKSATVASAMKQAGVENVSLTGFLNGLEYANQRAQVVQQLKL